MGHLGESLTHAYLPAFACYALFHVYSKHRAVILDSSPSPHNPLRFWFVPESIRRFPVGLGGVGRGYLLIYSAVSACPRSTSCPPPSSPSLFITTQPPPPPHPPTLALPRATAII
jgi:hypothetical protein